MCLNQSNMLCNDGLPVKEKLRLWVYKNVKFNSLIRGKTLQLKEKLCNKKLHIKSIESRGVFNHRRECKWMKRKTKYFSKNYIVLWLLLMILFIWYSWIERRKSLKEYTEKYFYHLMIKDKMLNVNIWEESTYSKQFIMSQ